MKVVYICSTASIVYMIKYQEPIKNLYNKDQDSFPHRKCAIIPCCVLATITHLMGSGFRGFSIMELLWTFSIILEAIAILPQLDVLRKYRLVENLTGKFVFFLGVYRALYIVNWIYRSQTERNYRHHWVVYICGVIQTALYLDFFYQYCKAMSYKHKPEELTERSESDDDDDETGLIFEQEMSNSRSAVGGAVSTAPLMLDNDMDEMLQGGSDNDSSVTKRRELQTSAIDIAENNPPLLRVV